MKLIGMTDFVLEMRKNNNKDNIRRFWSCENYAQFLKQSLTLGMFIPTDKDGNVLEEPCSIGVGNDFYLQRAINQYEEAKERVVFEGFSVSSNDTLVFNEDITIEFCINNIEVHNEFSQEYNVYIIEDLSNLDLTLTENAIKQIGL